MASRKEQKEQARARREALEREQASAALRKRRLGQLSGVVLAAAAIVAVAIALTSHGSKHGLSTGTKATALSRQVAASLAGIDQSGARLGSAGAPVKMDYYGDLECPVCRDFTEQAMGDLIAHEIKAGKLQVTYRSLETATGDPTTFAEQQAAAVAAGRQNRLWDYVELFYRQQGVEGSGYVNDKFLTAIARQVPGLNIAKWNADRKAPAVIDQVRTDATAAQVVGANATPTLVIKGAKGTKKLSGNVPYGDIKSAISDVSS